LDSAIAGTEKLFAVQKEALAAPYPGVLPEFEGEQKKKFGQ
ncbi:ribonuclease PH, partial [Mycobacterium kansasii]